MDSRLSDSSWLWSKEENIKTDQLHGFMTSGKQYSEEEPVDQKHQTCNTQLDLDKAGNNQLTTRVLDPVTGTRIQIRCVRAGDGISYSGPYFTISFTILSYSAGHINLAKRIDRQLKLQFLVISNKEDIKLSLRLNAAR